MNDQGRRTKKPEPSPSSLDEAMRQFDTGALTSALENFISVTLSDDVSLQVQGLIGAGHTLRRMGRLADARAMYESAAALKHQPLSGLALVALGATLEQLGSPEGARRAYQAAKEDYASPEVQAESRTRLLALGNGSEDTAPGAP